MRHLINANDKILHITMALNDPKIINTVLINARQAIRVNNMSSYFCVIKGKQFPNENYDGKFEFFLVLGHLYILLSYFPLEYDVTKVITQKELI